MSVLIVLDKTAYPTEVDSYDDTEEFTYSFSDRNGKVLVYETGLKKKKLAAIYNFKHVVLLQGNVYQGPRDEDQ